jgi:AAA+ ATPase superfamily predicted ATPase
MTGSAKLLVKVSDLELGFDFYGRGQDESMSFHAALDLPERLAVADKKDMIVVFDEFQDITRIGGNNVCKVMRSYFQNHHKVSYLFLGSKQSLIKSIFSNSQQAFYRFATILPIPPIPEDAWVSYITRRFGESRYTADEELVRYALRMTGGHPQDTMLLCSETYYAMLEAGGSSLTYELLRIGYKRAMTALLPIFEGMGSELNRNAESGKVLRHIARNESIYTGDHPGKVKRAVDSLVSESIIEKKERGRYAIPEPMFREYLLSLD